MKIPWWRGRVKVRVKRVEVTGFFVDGEGDWGERVRRWKGESMVTSSWIASVEGGM